MWPDMQSTVHKRSQARWHIEPSLDLRGSSAGALSSQSFSVWELEKQKIEKEGQCKTQYQDEREIKKGIKTQIYMTAPSQ